MNPQLSNMRAKYGLNVMRAGLWSEGSIREGGRYARCAKNGSEGASMWCFGLFDAVIPTMYR